MDVLTTLAVPGLIGGLLVSLVLAVAHRSARRRAASRRDEAILLDPINMAHIHVGGVGGLGLVAMAVIVAVCVPRIGVSASLGAASGILLAVGLILWRRRQGPLTSSGRRPGAATTLAIEDAPEATASTHDPDVRRTRLRLA
jgi:hypothetical protein